MSGTVILILLTFLAVALAILGICSVAADLLYRDLNRVSRRVDEEFRKRQREKARQSLLFKDLSPVALQTVQEDNPSRGLKQWFVELVEQSNLEMTPRRLLMYMAGAGLVLGPLVGLLSRNLLAGAAAGVFGALLPLGFVAYKRKVRLDKLMAQLPDAFDLMARVIRAGQTMSQALQGVADEFDQPIAGEFSYCYEQQNLGLPSELALRDLARRTGILEIKVFVLGLVVQQQTGGNLAEMLDKMAALIRERIKIRGKIKALTAEGRLQAVVLLALPPFMMVLLMALNWDYGSVLLEYPYLLAGMFIAEGLGALWIRKIVNFDF